MLESGSQLLYARTDQATVGLERRLNRSTQSDTTFLSLEVSPATNQSCRNMPQLGQFHLQLAFEAARALREDVQNQPGTIQHTTLQLPLEIAFLAR